MKLHVEVDEMYPSGGMNKPVEDESLASEDMKDKDGNVIGKTWSVEVEGAQELVDFIKRNGGSAQISTEAEMPLIVFMPVE
jgi:hypothetical protein